MLFSRCVQVHSWTLDETRLLGCPWQQMTKASMDILLKGTIGLSRACST